MSSKRGTLYLLLISRVTGATELDANLISLEQGRGGHGGLCNIGVAGRIIRQDRVSRRTGGREVDRGDHEETPSRSYGRYRGTGGCKRKGKRR